MNKILYRCLRSAEVTKSEASEIAQGRILKQQTFLENVSL